MRPPQQMRPPQPAVGRAPDRILNPPPRTRSTLRLQAGYGCTHLQDPAHWYASWGELSGLCQFARPVRAPMLLTAH
jgi:hypothetical protein